MPRYGRRRETVENWRESAVANLVGDHVGQGHGDPVPHFQQSADRGLCSRAEVTVNTLVNARMTKLRQMRWSPRGAQRVLQARAAVIDRRLKFGAISLAA